MLEKLLRFRHCPRFADFTIVGTTIRQSEIPASESGGASVPKAETPSDRADGELWSFVDHKGDKQWVWLALDAQIRKIVGVHIGERTVVSAEALWSPGVYRQCAVVYSDFWSAYGVVLPRQRHRAVGKETAKTS